MQKVYVLSDDPGFTNWALIGTEEQGQPSTFFRLFSIYFTAYTVINDTPDA